MKHCYKLILNCLFLAASLQIYAQQKNAPQNFYYNPIIHADYSDPDVINVGDDFYMVASSFNAVPGLPILHSKDLVHWTIMGYALKQQIPTNIFDKPQHGNGVWAPSIRFHKGEFYIFYPDPDYGIYLTKAKKITGPWTTPVLVEAGKGLIDPCPLWDDNGNVYLVHAYAGSRAGFKSIIVIKELNTTADKVISEAVLVYDGHMADPTIEGPKFYKRNGYYYIFAPAGGVSTGWQTVLRSKFIYGPYERKIIMQQGSTNINGPHQGAWIHTNANEDWFIHFQDKGAYGRVVHLQPMQWKNDWPVIGEDKDGKGIGMPVSGYRMPKTSSASSGLTLPDSDEFNENKLGMQWQWQANPKSYWAFCYPGKGVLRLNSIVEPDSARNLWDAPNLLLQKFPAKNFSAISKVSFTPKTTGEKFGLLVMGANYAGISLVKKEDSIYMAYIHCYNADKGNAATEKLLVKTDSGDVYLKLEVDNAAECTFSYSRDGIIFAPINEKFTAVAGKWIGAKFGFFCTSNRVTNDAGFADIDWVRIKK
jgi:beta-xylosidase